MNNNPTGDPSIIKGQPIPYQLCPKCNGEGTLRVYPNPSQVTSAVNPAPTHVLCGVCNGAKVILMYQP